MSEELFVRCCAPTLAGLKTGSMFSCAYRKKEDLFRDIRSLNRTLSCRGLRLLPLRYRNGKALLYVYRPASLQSDLSRKEVQDLLQDAGYTGLCGDQCVLQLIRRMRNSEGFPHEVGLFLSYPPEDVRGFIENHAQNYKLIGYWKVYGDEKKARKTFETYRKCTDSYCKFLKQGHSLTELTVAV
ncbi:MAG: DUF3793 family protein [Oscillospiraceae bacterium]|nr:DUF3793 family protein [Oscillospiraceae bacterium]